MVDLERLNKVAQELESAVPSDIQEAREILKQKESVINQAHLEARRVKEAGEQEAMTISVAAQQEHESKVDETEIVRSSEAKAGDINQQALQDAQQIVQDAQRKAYRILDEAETTATTRRDGANQYAREILFDLEERLASLLGQVRRGIDTLGLETDTIVPSESAISEVAVS